LQLEEELRDTQKKMMQVENDLDKAQEELAAARQQLEEKEKKVQEVRILFLKFLMCDWEVYLSHIETNIVSLLLLKIFGVKLKS